MLNPPPGWALIHRFSTPGVGFRELYMNEMGKLLIFLGAGLVLAGAFLLLFGKVPGFGKLPGDILIKKENLSFYVMCQEKEYDDYVKVLIKTVIIEEGRG